MTTPAAALALRARGNPGGLAFAVNGEPISYGGLADAAARLAAVLAADGLVPGDHCAVALPTGLDFIRCVYGLQWLGAVPVALNPALTAQEIAALFHAADCRLLIATPGVLAGMREAARGEALRDVTDLCARAASATPLPVHRGVPDEVAYLQFTSGTTGEPRAAVILQRNLAASLKGTSRALGFGPGDVMAGAIPLHHNFGLVRFVWTPVHAGCPCHLLSQTSGAVQPWLALMTEARATVTAGPDFLYRAAAQRGDSAGVNLRSLRFASNGGESARFDTITRFERRFDVPGTVRPGYGLTEATLGVCTLTPGLPVRTLDDGTVTCGPPFPGFEIRIADEDGVEQPRGERGEILARGAAVFPGYYRDPEGTDAVLRDGWLHTGDQGVVDADGFLYVTGRYRALIKRGGVTILPATIERAVEGIEGMGRSAAIGVPDAAAGTDRLVVFVEIAQPGDAPSAGKHGAMARAIAAATQQAVGQQPGEIVLVDAGTLPRTGSGKIRHGQLRSILEGADAGARLAVIARFPPR